ncbi:hypothetical protein FNV43_RR07712 [Rhamnella rubrinervis]|uniref:Uncharacterized protein n=1 Tax=Rhamnella rubrinervis TaxID=2594499 RepID=A0A8K0HFF8_9ROSA|nr:hypothetical protein FNV43_RR07712 [Rhamnella rubrinervis]
MAYYSSNHDNTGFGEYYQTPYANYCAYNLPQDSVPYNSSYEPSLHSLFDYNPSPRYYAYDPNPSWSTVAYSTSTLTETKSITYDPNFYSGDYDRPVTQFVISYSVSEGNLPEFEEYDPTPYSGGYDIDQTYGKPLPPSEKTCYPRSGPETNAPPFSGVTDGSIVAFDGQEKIDEQAVKPHSERNPIQANEEEQGKINNQGEQKNEETGIDHQPWSGQVSTYENGLNEGNNHEYGKQVSQYYPSGSGLEAMDLCESLFGYWPCLTRYSKEANACPQVADEGSHGNLWKGTADYLFGSSYPYGERKDFGGENYGEAIYSYERHYQGQPLYRQVEYEEE